MGTHNISTPQDVTVTLNDGTKVTLKWDKRFGTRRSTQFNKVQAYVDQAVLRYSDPYTPKDKGTLIASGMLATHIGSGVVRYTQPYSRRLYYSKGYHFKGAPQRGAQWFERMKVRHKSAILREAAKLSGGTAK